MNNLDQDFYCHVCSLYAVVKAMQTTLSDCRFVLTTDVIYNAHKDVTKSRSFLCSKDRVALFRVGSNLYISIHPIIVNVRLYLE